MLGLQGYKIDIYQVHLPGHDAQGATAVSLPATHFSTFEQKSCHFPQLSIPEAVRNCNVSSVPLLETHWQG